MKETVHKPSDNGSKRYERFVRTEYDSIAQAYFNTVNTISTFFKHYLLIVSLPISVLLLCSAPGNARPSQMSSSDSDWLCRWLRP